MDLINLSSSFETRSARAYPSHGIGLALIREVTWVSHWELIKTRGGAGTLELSFDSLLSLSPLEGCFDEEEGAIAGVIYHQSRRVSICCSSRSERWAAVQGLIDG